MLTLLYTNRQLITGRMGVEPIPLLRWFQPSSPQAPAATPSNLTSLYESFLLLSMQPAGGFSSQPSQALFNKLLVFYPQANGTTQSVFVVDTIASSICGRHIRQCLFPIGYWRRGEDSNLRTAFLRSRDQQSLAFNLLCHPSKYVSSAFYGLGTITYRRPH